MVQRGSRRRAAGQVSGLAHGEADPADEEDGRLVVLRGGPFAGKPHWVEGTPVVIIVSDDDAAGAAGPGGGRPKGIYVRRDDGHYEYRPDAGKILTAIARGVRGLDDHSRSTDEV